MKFSLLYRSILIALCFACFDSASANWLPTITTCTSTNSTTINSGTVTVPKREGVSKYCAKQELLENPYSGATITFNGSFYTILYADGTVTTQTRVPNQTPTFRGSYIIKSKIYRFDKTPPNTCISGVARVYYGSLPASSTGIYLAYTGAWTNKELFSRARCTDRVPVFGITVSGCDKTFYDTNTAHASTGVLLTLSDNAGNKTLSHLCSYGLTVLKDSNPPQISVTDPNGDYLYNLGDPSYETGTMLATDSAIFTVDIEDDTDGSSAASGIKGYSGQIYRSTDDQGNAVPLDITCSIPYTRVVPPVDPTNAYSLKHTLSPITVTCNTGLSFRKTGTYKLKVFAEDAASNLATFDTNIIVYPNPDISLTEITTPQSGIRSNGVDTQNIHLLVSDKFDNPIRNYPVENIYYSNSEDIFLDEIQKTGTALAYGKPVPTTTSSTGVVALKLVSVAPGSIVSNGFNISLKKWTSVSTYITPSGVLTSYSPAAASPLSRSYFIRPFTGVLKMNPSYISLGYTHTGFLDLYRADFAPTLFTVYNFSDSFRAFDPNISLNYKSTVSLTGITFIPEQVGSNIMDFGVSANPYMAYTMSGKDIVSYITPTPTGTGGDLLRLENTGAVNRIYIVGNKQTLGKEGFVANVENLGSTSTVNLRNAIKKNVMVAVRNRKPNSATDLAPSIVGGIKYIVGNYTIGDSEALTRDWDTLVVIDGNITIDTEFFNTNEKKVFITALRNNYDDSKGNIYIKPKVRYLSSLVYVDGSLKSVDDSTGAPFPDLSIMPSYLLQNQLVLKGVFISRNTIGGAVAGTLNSGREGKKYTIPGNKGSNSLSEAMSYDLSFLRSGNVGFDNPLGTKLYNQGNNAFTVIIYDANYILTPPPAFSAQP